MHVKCNEDSLSLFVNSTETSEHPMLSTVVNFTTITPQQRQEKVSTSEIQISEAFYFKFATVVVERKLPGHRENCLTKE